MRYKVKCIKKCVGNFYLGSDFEVLKKQSDNNVQ